MAPTQLSGGTLTLGDDLTVTRVGYGAMQLAGPHVFGPPADRDSAIAVLREVVKLGITHIDTSDYYGPHVTNQIIRQALHPYPDDLRIVTKVGARRDAEGGWPTALAPEELRQAVHENLENLGVDALDVVNLRVGGRNALTLREAGYPPVEYIPFSDVDSSVLEPTDHATYCPYKGDASYYSVPIGGMNSVNAVWTYEAPFAAVAEIKGHIAFYPERVDTIVEQSPADRQDVHPADAGNTD